MVDGAAAGEAGSRGSLTGLDMAFRIWGPFTAKVAQIP
jgi:hypothetical protein